jgi:hypothetical protein
VTTIPVHVKRLLVALNTAVISVKVVVTKRAVSHLMMCALSPKACGTNIRRTIAIHVKQLGAALDAESNVEQ